MKPSGIGGQAVLEGVMMKNKSKYAVAVRKPDKSIVVDVQEYHGLGEKNSFFNLPVIRGVVSFAESLIIGMKTLTFSADLLEEDENEAGKDEDRKGKDKKSGGIENILTVLFAIVLAVGIFMVLPYFLSQIFAGMIESATLLTLLEGVIRIVLFIGYVLAISLMNDIKRVFMYHGAEHKTINCIENGMELTVYNVRKQSKHHKRCGTSFMLIVMFVSIVLFMFIKTSSPVLRLVLRLLLVPVIAGISYEFVRLAGRSESKLIGILSKPGMWLQALTTREPDDSMIEVAIASVEAVFDWEKFLDDNGMRKNTGRRSDVKKQKTGKNAGKQGAKQSVRTGAKAEDKQSAKSGAKTENKQSAKSGVKTEKKQPVKQNDVRQAEKAEITSAGKSISKVSLMADAAKKEAATAVEEISPEELAARKQQELKNRVIIKETASNSLLDDDDEDDEVLKALDHFFVYEGQKTVLEKGSKKKS